MFADMEPQTLLVGLFGRKIICFKRISNDESGTSSFTQLQ
jgi:hypothetical protein